MMLGYVISIIMSVISGILLAILKSLIEDNKKLRQQKKSEENIKNKAMQDGMMLLLKIQLIEYHDKYMNEETIPTYVYDNFDEMYTVYEDLGGNGMVKHMKESVDRLRLANIRADRS